MSIKDLTTIEVVNLWNAICTKKGNDDGDRTEFGVMTMSHGVSLHLASSGYAKDRPEEKPFIDSKAKAVKFLREFADALEGVDNEK